jgi:hypothetical protein
MEDELRRIMEEHVVISGLYYGFSSAFDTVKLVFGLYLCFICGDIRGLLEML